MIQQKLQQILHKGDKYTRAEIRTLLQSLYIKYGIQRKPKATDLSLLGLKTKRTTIVTDGKRHEAVLII